MKKDAAAIRDANISLALDSYDDIFSDFDPRAYGARALSHDFLEECIRAARDKPKDGMELRLLVPAKKRDKKSEATIKRRLAEHFNKHHDRLRHERGMAKHAGLAWVAAGTGLAIWAARLKAADGGFASTLLFVIIEPASWFSFWTGFDKIFLERTHDTQKRQFYAKMAKADILFESY